MKKLFETDYVLFDKDNDTLVRWSKDDSIVIFGSKEDAEFYNYGNESVIRCTDLPQHHQENLIKQLNP